jgi:hypothetical protein
MVEAAENWARFKAPDRMDGSPDRRILVQGEVWSALIVIARVTPQQMAQMLLAEHDDMVKAVPLRQPALSQDQLDLLRSLSHRLIVS